MSNELCPCSKLEWLPEHYQLEHHPDCVYQLRPAGDYFSGLVASGIPTTIRTQEVIREAITIRGVFLQSSIVEEKILQFYQDPYQPEKVTIEIPLTFKVLAA